MLSVYPCGPPIGTERAAGEVGKGTATMSDDKDRDEDVISTRQYIRSLRRLQSNRVEPAPASAVADADSLSSGGFSARNRMRDSARTSSNESSPEKMKTLGRWDKLVEDDGGEEMDQETAEKHLFGSIAKRHDRCRCPCRGGPGAPALHVHAAMGHAHDVAAAVHCDMDSV